MDIIFVLFLSALTLVQGFIGFELGLHERPDSDKRWRYRLLVIGIGLLTVGIGGWQAKRNAKDQTDQRRKLEDANNKLQGRLDQSTDLLGQTQTKVDGLRFLLEHQQKPLTAEQESEIIKAYSHPGVLPAGMQSNGEIRGRAQKLISRMKDLMAKTASDQQALNDYWTSGKPVDPARNRIQEYDSLRTNEQFTFQATMLQEYVYLFQEVFSRTPADKLSAAGYGDKESASRGWLFAGRVYQPDNDLNFLIGNLERVLKLLPD